MARGLSHQDIARRLAEGDAASVAEEKGAALEDVVVWSFCKVPGVSLMGRDTTNRAGSSEIDIVLYNRGDRLGLQFLPPWLLFECKNWAARVDSSTVEVFLGKVRSRRLDVGILVAANGITGDRTQLTAANDIIRGAFDRDNIKLLVVTRADLEAFRVVDDVVELMKEKCAAFLLGLGSFTPVKRRGGRSGKK
jgi:hypothetical protein